MSNLKSKVLKFEKLSKQIPTPITSLTLRQLYALGLDKLGALIASEKLSDKQLELIINDAPEEEVKWMKSWVKSLSDEELDAVIRGDLMPLCSAWMQ